MFDVKRNKVLHSIGAALCAVLMGVLLPSCERIYDDLPPGPHGISLRFVYDYNMEYANAFPHNVDCLTLLIYDSEGNYVGRRVVTGPELADEAYRMPLELEKGEYRFVAYGGLACERSSFVLTPGADEEAAHGRQHTMLDPECLARPERRNLHGFYWGELVMATGDNYPEGTVEMKKNTNDIRVVLQHLNGQMVDVRQFEFEIRDDNTLLGPDNEPVPNGEVSYLPYAVGQSSTGILPDGSQVVVAYAELSTSRLVTGNSPRLIVRRVSDGGTVIDIPLKNYLLQLRSDLYAEMGEQEYLDRESRWSLLFFLDASHSWVRTQIKINDWTVRINDIEN